MFSCEQLGINPTADPQRGSVALPRSCSSCSTERRDSRGMYPPHPARNWLRVAPWVSKSSTSSPPYPQAKQTLTAWESLPAEKCLRWQAICTYRKLSKAAEGICCRLRRYKWDPTALPIDGLPLKIGLCWLPFLNSRNVIKDANKVRKQTMQIPRYRAFQAKGKQVKIS